MTATFIMENSITADLISVFENDQRKVVFSALSDYLHLGLFTDVSLTCGLQMVRAHKVVLAASSKFFRDSFKHCPSLTTVDLDKELAPHGLALTFDDVQLIIGILYCVGTVEISSQRIESLLLIAQVMGIPSLIAFLKRVRETVIINNTFPHVSDRMVSNSHNDQFSPNSQFLTNTSQCSPFKRLVSLHQQSASSPNSQALVYLFPPSTSVLLDASSSGGSRGSGSHTGFIPVPTGLASNRNSSFSTDPYGNRKFFPGNELALSNTFQQSMLHQERSLGSKEMKLQPSQNFGKDLMDHVTVSDHLLSQEREQLVSREQQLVLNNERHQQQRLLLTPPSRSGSRATLASLGSFSLNPIASPALRESVDVTCGNVTSNPIKGVTSVLDGFDPSFLSQLNNLQATQIDDLENALLPHLDGNQETKNSDENDGGNNDPNESQFLDEDNLGNLSDGDLADSFHSEETSKIELTKQELSQLQIVTHSLNNSRSPSRFQEPESDPIAMSEKPQGSSTPKATTTVEPAQIFPTVKLVPDVNKISSQILPKFLKDDEDSSDSGEVISIESGSGSRVKLAIPGTSNSVTLNFPADVLEQMRKSLLKSTQDFDIKKNYAVPSDGKDCDAVTSSILPDRDVRRVKNRKKDRRKKLKSSCPKPFCCQLCRKAFSKRRLLEKHLAFHVEQNRPCQICGKVFDKNWMLQQHLAVDHGTSKDLECKDCGKVFKWPRNLLAHVATTHQREMRYRCRLCPLTFLRKKSYIKHHQGKHADSPETWCKFCFQIFENVKQREEHSCDRVENTGRVTICHCHPTPIVFRHQQDLKDHLKEHHQEQEGDEQVVLDNIQKSCPICQKKFLLKKNLLTHMKRIHECEGKGATFKCSACPKAFYYDSDRVSHENTHRPSARSGETDKQFECETCSKSYSSLKALKDHTKNVHSENKEVHSCKTCGKVLSDKYKLKYHMKVHSDKKGFKCHYCSVQFKGSENLRKHLKKFHQRDLNPGPAAEPDKAEDEESDSLVPDACAQDEVLHFSDL